MNLTTAERVVELFMAGNSINHIVYLLNYRYRIDDVSSAIRERLKRHEHYQVQHIDCK
jgi:hypothetical protein